jgi:hypothetical protein
LFLVLVNRRNQVFDMAQTLWRDERQVRPDARAQRIDRHRPLTNEQVARPVHHHAASVRLLTCCSLSGLRLRPGSFVTLSKRQIDR